ncbi:MAG TPA: aromatic-ring-hydroxylating dioxygenase subunit beta [Alphaproteobacteria bacterium]|nr:aromatic-ring-hydroxylating dioxygenase subunit beta [Alphaproteobacteria bacterium]
METAPVRVKGFPVGPVAQAPFRELRREIEEFHAEYCYVLDNNDIERWPRFFAEDALYRITARENAEGDLPVGLVYCEGLAMIKDRAFAIAHTAMFAPRYLQHIVTNLRVTGAEAAGTISAEANYLVLQTLIDEDTRILQAGRYFDRFVRGGDRLLLKERHCVYDTLRIDNSLVYPV